MEDDDVIRSTGGDLMEEIYTKPSDAYTTICKVIKLEGSAVKPRGQLTREMLNVQLRVTEPWHVPFAIDGRKLNPTITGIEYLSLVGQIGVEPMTRHKARPLAEYHDYGIAYGNYGSRLRGQLTEVVKELTNDPDSRRAVMTIYDGGRDLGHDTKDVPCTLSLQFIVRKNHLHLRTTMRSNDAYLGLPYDLQQFCLLLCTMAQVLRLDVGEYTHCVGSMHLYEKDVIKLNGFGPASYVDLSEAPLFVMDTGDVFGRLQQVVMLCQSIACNFPFKPVTSFERWLAEVMK